MDPKIQLLYDMFELPRGSLACSYLSSHGRFASAGGVILDSHVSGPTTKSATSDPLAWSTALLEVYDSGLEQDFLIQYSGTSPTCFPCRSGSLISKYNYLLHRASQKLQCVGLHYMSRIIQYLQRRRTILSVWKCPIYQITNIAYSWKSDSIPTLPYLARIAP